MQLTSLITQLPVRLIRARLYWRSLFCVLVVLSGCNSHPHQVTRGIYYWKNSFRTDGYIDQRLKDIQCNNIYLHCFDVDWNAAKAAPGPVAIVRMPPQQDYSFTIIPVVFITQPAIRNTGAAQLPALAANISKLLQQLMTTLPVKEIQIDCDWTGGTRDTYFKLLHLLKEQTFFHDKTLSCTIRLHQVKYRLKSGIPPADKGLLMCYNVGNLKKPGDHNSILDAALVKDYLASTATYPLPLDVALPLFSWCIQFRGSSMKGILRDVEPTMVTGNPLFRHTSANLYTCTTDTIWQGYAFSRGDLIRVEVPALPDLQTIAAFTAREIKNNPLSVIFFHADSVTLSKYSNDELKAIYNAYD